MKNYFICQTMYHLYITLLLTYKNNEENIIILTDFTKKFSSITDRIENLEWIKNVYYIENERLTKQLNSGNCISKIIKGINFKKYINDIFEKEYIFLKDIEYNGNFYLYVDVSNISRYIMFNCKNITLLDDGEGVYFEDKFNLTSFIKNYIFSIPRGKGRSKYIKQIYYRYPEKLNKKHYNKIKYKLKKFDLNCLEEKVDEVFMKEIFKLFDIDTSILNNKISSIIFTQPFSEDGFIHEEYKIKIYKDIIDKYAIGKVYLKPHPREKTKYNEIFKDTEVKLISKDFPVECFNLLNTKIFNKGIAIQSTAITTANFIEKKINLGYDSYPKLKMGKEVVDKLKIK